MPVFDGMASLPTSEPQREDSRRCQGGSTITKPVSHVIEIGTRHKSEQN